MTYDLSVVNSFALNHWGAIWQHRTLAAYYQLAQSILSVVAICFEDRFCASKKGGIVEGE